MQLKGDYHTHTHYSDGLGSMEEMVKGALSKGLKELAITDHGPANYLYKGETWDFYSFKREISSLGRHYPEIRLLLGVEANIINQEGELDLSPRIIRGLDILLAGLHLQIKSKDFGFIYKGKNILHSHLWSHLFPKIREINTRAVIQALKRYPIHILTHPGLHMHIHTAKVAKVAGERGTFMELNSRHRKVGVDYLKTVTGSGALLVVNSDAHRPREVGKVESLYPLIKASGLGREFFVNLNF